MAHNNQNIAAGLADAAIGDITRDFTIVGRQRVHGWFAWAIVGIVFGMALGIIYVANRSVYFDKSSAAVAPAKISISWFGSDGNETFLIDKKTGKDVTGDVVKIGKYKTWSAPIDDTSWISFRPKTNLAGGGPAKRTLVSFFEKVNIDGVPLSGQLLVMADDNVRVLVNGTEVFKSTGPIIKAPQLINIAANIGARQLGRGDNIFQFDVLQNLKAGSQPYGLDYRGYVAYNSFADLNMQAQGFDVERQDGLAAIKKAINDNAAAHNGVFTCATGPLPTSPTFMQSPGEPGVGYDIGPCLVPAYIASLPFDPEASQAFWTSVTAYNTYFTISQASGGAITLQALFHGDRLITQTFTIATAPTLTIATGFNTPPAKSVFMGSTANDLFAFRISADKGDDVRINDLTVTDVITSNASRTPSFQNLTLWNGSSKVAGPVSLIIGTSTGNGQATFLFNQTVVVPKNSGITLTLKGDVATAASGNATAGSIHVFKFSSNSDITAQAVNNAALTVTVTGAPASGNAMTVKKGTLSVSATPSSGATNRVRSTVDDISTLSFTANGATATINSVIITFNGSAISYNNGPFAVSLDSVSTQTGIQVNTQWDSSRNTWTATFNPQFVISADTTVQYKVRIDSSGFINSTGSDSLAATILYTGDVSWSDGSGNFSLDPTVVPLTVANITYQ